MSRPTAKKAARRWVAVTITVPTADVPSEGVICIRGTRTPNRMHLSSGPHPTTPALAAIVALCSIGASYAAFQCQDGSIVEVASISPSRAKDALEGAMGAVELPQVDAREVLDGGGPVTVVA